MQFLKVKISRDQEIRIPYIVFEGKKEGPTCVISGGMHGDELNGIALARKVIDYCENNKIEKKLKGKIIILPILNPSGFENKKRFVQYDKKDLNRSFSKRKKTASNKIADALVKNFYSQATFGMDCHDSGRRNVLIPHARIHDSEKSKCKKCTREMARAFGSRIIVERKGKRGMIAVEMERKYNLPILTIETGGALKLFPKFVDKGLEGILNILRHYEMLPGEVKLPRKQYFLKHRFGVKAPATGIISLKKKLGQRIHAGDKIGTIYIPTRNKEVDLISPMCGLLFSIQYQETIAKDEIVYSILEDRKCHGRRRRTASVFEEVQNIVM